MYQVGQPPTLNEPEAFVGWLRQELEKIESAFVDFDFAQLKELHVEPVRPRDGMVVFADGTDWDPGSGQGFYGYYNGAWESLG